MNQFAGGEQIMMSGGKMVGLWLGVLSVAERAMDPIGFAKDRLGFWANDSAPFNEEALEGSGGDVFPFSLGPGRSGHGVSFYIWNRMLLTDIGIAVEGGCPEWAESWYASRSRSSLGMDDADNGLTATWPSAGACPYQRET